MQYTWAVLKRSFISQGRKELLPPPLTHHLRGHSASLRVEIPVFCLRASLRWLTHLRVLLTRTFLWPPPFLLHNGGVHLTHHPGCRFSAFGLAGFRLKRIHLYFCKHSYGLAFCFSSKSTFLSNATSAGRYITFTQTCPCKWLQQKNKTSGCFQK